MKWEERLVSKREMKKKYEMRINNERIDEKFAKEAVWDFFAKQGEMGNIEISPSIEGTNPDYLIYFNNEKKLLEIVQSGTGFILKRNNKVQRCEDEKRKDDLFVQLMKLLSKWVNPGQTIILVIDSFRNLDKNVLNEKLKEVFKNNLKTKLKIISLENGDNIRARSVMYYKKRRKEYSPLKVLYGSSLAIPDQGLQNNLSGQAKYILELCITKKEKIYALISLNKWLVILNNHPLLTASDYKDAYKELAIKHSFEKIFIVEIDKTAHELF